MGSPQDFAAMLSLFEKTSIVPAIDRVYSMDEAAEAAARMAESNQFGKIVLRIE